MPSGFDVVRSAPGDVDLDQILDHLFDAFLDFGDVPDVALERAVERVREVKGDLARLGKMPFQGGLEPSIMEGLRHVMQGRAVFYFLVDEHHREVQVLGIWGRA